MTDTAKIVKKKDLVVTRVFDVPVEQVWMAWIDPKQVMRWWGPKGFTSPLAKIDFREGGTSLYRKIVPMQLIEFIQNFADKNGRKADSVAHGLPPDFPQDVRSTVTFKALGDSKTEMTVMEYGYTSDQILEMSKAGLEQCLDKMAAIFAKV